MLCHRQREPAFACRVHDGAGQRVLARVFRGCREDQALYHVEHLRLGLRDTPAGAAAGVSATL